MILKWNWKPGIKKCIKTIFCFNWYFLKLKFKDMTFQLQSDVQNTLFKILNHVSNAKTVNL